MLLFLSKPKTAHTFSPYTDEPYGQSRRQLQKHRGSSHKTANGSLSGQVIWHLFRGCYIQQYPSLWKIQSWTDVFYSFGEFAELRKATISFVISAHLPVCPDWETRLPLDRFSPSLIMQTFTEIRWENSDWLISGKKSGILQEDLSTHMTVSCRNLPGWRKVQDKTCNTK